MRLLHVTVERFELEIQLAEIFGLVVVDFQFDVHKAVESSVEEEQVNFKIITADLDRIMAADKAEITAKLDQEVLEVFYKAVVKVGFGVVLGQVEKLDKIAVFEDRSGIGMYFSHRWCEFCRRESDPLE